MTSAAVDRATRLTYRLAALFTFLTVIMGAAVCATESGASCPSWPGCYVGSLTPSSASSTIEFGHRVIAFVALVLMGAAGWRGRRHPDRRVRWFPWVALAAAVSSAVFGMMVILFSLSKTLGIVDLTAALVALCLTCAAAVRVAPATRSAPGRSARLVSRLAWSGAAAVIVLHQLGIVVATTGSFVRCLGWPVWRVAPVDLYPAVQVLRIAVGAGAAGTVLVAAALALRVPGLRLCAALTGGLLVAELVLGQVIVGQFTGGEPRQVAVAAVYSMLAVAVLASVALLAARAGALTRAGRGPQPAGGVTGRGKTVSTRTM